VIILMWLGPETRGRHFTAENWAKRRPSAQKPQTPCGKIRAPRLTASAVLPRLSWTLSVTMSGNHVVPAASGGDGSRLQVTPGIVSTALVVVCEKVVATVYDQSQATIVPGADDVLPLNVQLIVLPPFVIVQVSVSVGPVTPKLAVATIGRVTDSAADPDVPP
jgi:hypothetical protein